MIGVKGVNITSQLDFHMNNQFTFNKILIFFICQTSIIFYRLNTYTFDIKIRNCCKTVNETTPHQRSYSKEVKTFIGHYTAFNNEQN